MHRRIQRVHPDGGIGQPGHHDQPDIDPQQLLRDIRGTRQRLAKGVKPLGPKELHPPHPHHGQEDHRHKGDPKAPGRIQQPPPQVHARRHRIQPVNHRGPGGGDPRGRLEIGFGKLQMRHAKDKGQAGKDRQSEPDHRGQQIGLPNIKGPAQAVGRRQRHQPAHTPGDQRRKQKGLRIVIARPPIHRSRGQHQDRQNDQDTTEDIGDGAEINHDGGSASAPPPLWSTDACAPRLSRRGTASKTGADQGFPARRSALRSAR